MNGKTATAPFCVQYGRRDVVRFVVSRRGCASVCVTRGAMRVRGNGARNRRTSQADPSVPHIDCRDEPVSSRLTPANAASSQIPTLVAATRSCYSHVERVVPSVIVATTVLLSSPITDTVFEPEFVTYTLGSRCELLLHCVLIAASVGLVPTGTVAITMLFSVSITATEASLKDRYVGAEAPDGNKASSPRVGVSWPRCYR